jgi:tRNA-modifying protein YgfZ
MHTIANAVTFASEQAIAVREHRRRIFRLLGKDGLDLLQRLSTNNLLTGPSSRVVLTAFCNEKGRLIEAAELVITPADSFLICSDSGTGKLMAWIAKYTITEEIELIDVTPEFAVYSVVGPQAIPAALELDLIAHGRQRNELHSSSRVRGSCWEGMFGSLPALRLLVKSGDAGEVAARLHEVGIQTSESPAVHEFLRVLHSVPVFGHEITAEFNPYEAGLKQAVSLDKGCYIGQEVLARIDTYQKYRRELSLLWSDAPEQPKRGTDVVIAGEKAGVVTSSVMAGGRMIVLAVLESRYLETHDVIRIMDYPYVINAGPIPPFSMLAPPDKS